MKNFCLHDFPIPRPFYLFSYLWFPRQGILSSSLIHQNYYISDLWVSPWNIPKRWIWKYLQPYPLSFQSSHFHFNLTFCFLEIAWSISSCFFFFLAKLTLTVRSGLECCTSQFYCPITDVYRDCSSSSSSLSPLNLQRCIFLIFLE